MRVSCSITGINLTTPPKGHQTNGAGAPGVVAAATAANGPLQTENAVTITSNCDKQQILNLTNEGEKTETNGVGASVATLSYPENRPDGALKSIPESVAAPVKIVTSLPPSPKGGSPPAQQLQHVHKKYRREEHVKISQQQQSQHQSPAPQQSPQHSNGHHHLQLTPTHSTPSGSPNGGGGGAMLLSPYSERSMSSRKYSEESLSFHYQSPVGGGGGGNSGNGRSGGKQGAGKQKHPANVPYNPFVHTNNKPPLSFSSLIFMAIENATEKALPVKEIYAWIVKHFPYFKTAPTGWKNSVRHNLSLNKCFQKVEKAPVSRRGLELF